MNNIIKNAFTKTWLALAVASASTAAQAASFQLIEQSASGQGSAYAGAAALGEDASTVYFNPAAMTRLSGQQIVVAGHVISPNAAFTNKGSTDALGTALTGPNSDTGDPAFVPNFYYTAELANELYVGVGVNVPFGLATEYDDGWVGRYHALRSEISSININPSIAWKANDALSVGFGLSIQYLELELTNNIDSYGACINLAANSQGAFTGADCVNAGLTGFSVASQDSAVKLDGDSLEFGWNAGILYDVDDKNRIGVAYRSSIKHNVEGDASYNLDPRLQPFADGVTAGSGFNVLQNTPLEASAELPESFSFSYVGEVNDKWTALFDWTWTGWSHLDVVTIRQKGGIPGQEATLDLEYKNTNRYSVGVNYQHTDKLIYRGGLALDETPIRSPESTSARIPGNDRIWLSLGAGYAPSASWSFDVAYSHLFIDDTEINNFACASSCSGAALIGTYESSVDILSAQANFFF
jgi:long-chain fatty acid transport protein